MRRKLVQWLATVLSNAYLPGFFEGRIYKGPLKQFCVPGLNCYSCPGALGSCPIGSLQAVAGSIKFQFSFYIVGLLTLFGLAFGRFVCGFLCPFGLIQELIHKFPFPRMRRLWKGLRYVKYAVLAVFVVILPIFVTNRMGMGDPAFCKFICPAGTLTAGLPLIAANAPLREALGGLFALKAGILAATILGCLANYRFFCKVLCPLGAIYALFNRVSFYQLRCDKSRCTRCGACAGACKMEVDPTIDPKHAECIRCGDCVKACPHAALKAGFGGGERAAASAEDGDGMP